MIRLRAIAILTVLLAVGLLMGSYAFAQDDPPPDDFTAEVIDPAQAEDAEIESMVDIDADFWGKKVRKINYRVPEWMPAKEIKRVTRIGAGKSLSRWRVRQTLRRLFLLGNIDNARIRAIPLPDGQVDVEVKIYPTYLIRDIIVKDNYTFNYSEIVDEILHIAPLDDYHPSYRDKWEKKLEAALGRMGHLKAQVHIQPTFTKWKKDNKVDLLIKFNERQTFKISRISLQGDLGPFSRNKILNVLKWRTGMKYEQEKFVKGLARLKKFLKRNNYLEALVPNWDITDRSIARVDIDQSTIDVFLNLDIGPQVIIDFPLDCFTCAQKKWKIPEKLGLANQRRFNRWIVKDYQTKIEEYFKERGYYQVTVIGDYEETFNEKGPVKKITFTLNKGKKIKVRKIVFRNNRHFTDKKLRGLLSSEKYFTESGFDTDLENIINFYNKNGFLKAKVLQKRLEHLQGEGLFIQISLYEGPQTILKEVKTDGFDVFHGSQRDDIIKSVDKLLEAGKPLNPFVVESAKAKFIAAYLNKGYIKVRVKDQIKFSEDNKEATVTFKITEGQRYKFGKVYIHGNKMTKKYVISRELFVKEGEYYSYEDVFESEQALVKLGFFKSVQIAPVDLEFVDRTVDMLVSLQERNSGFIETGVGYNTYFGYSTAFETGHKNLAGHGRRLTFHVDAAMQDERFYFDNRHVAVDFGWPWIARVPLDGKLTIFDNQDTEIGYNLRSFGTVIGVSTYLPKMFYNLNATKDIKILRKLFNYYTTGLDYEFAKDFIFNVDEGVTEDPGEILITVLSPHITRDERNNPFNPTRGVKSGLGSVLSLRANWSAPMLQSQVHYMQVIARASTYWGFMNLKDWGKIVYAQNLVSGHGQVLRETDIIPISRRFYLGGSTTIRGFAQNQIAPLAPDTNTPIGGNYFLQSNSELRVPLPASLGVLLFFDAGDVTKDFEHFYIDTMRATTGLGLRYITPVGPISADYGIKLNRRPDETIGEFYITIGNAF